MYFELMQIGIHRHLVTMLLLLVNWHSAVYAHSPHDVIDALEISPEFESDQILFIVISDRIYRSKDGGYTWKELINGLDTKSLYSDITIPSNFDESQVLFLATEGDGIFKSHDSGNSWSRINKGLGSLNIRGNEAHPQFATKKILLASAITGGLYKSANGGKDWYEVIGAGSVITAIAYHSDGNNPFVYAGDNRGNIYFSNDDGDTWKIIRQVDNAGAITVIAFPPLNENNDYFLLGTEQRGVLEVSGDTRTIIPINISVAGQPIKDIAFSPNYDEDQTVFVSTWNEVYLSKDKGETWRKPGRGLTKNKQADSEQYKSAHFRDVRFSGNYSIGGAIYIGGFDGLFSSSDGGETFIQLETLPVSIIRRLAVASDKDKNLSLIVSTYGGGIYISKDEGKNWGIKNKGVRVPRPGGIVFSPTYEIDNTIIAAIRGYLLRSRDRGDSWQSTKLNPIPTWKNQMHRHLRKLNVPDSWIDGLLTDADQKKPMATKLAISPDFHLDRTIYFGTRWHGIYKSTDGGHTAEAIWLPEGEVLPVSALEISNGFASDGTLFAGLRGGGVFKSVTDGDSWVPINSGLHFLDLWKGGIKHQIAQYDISLVISPSYAEDKTIYLGSSEGLYISTNGGNAWSKLDILDSRASDIIIGLAISPGFKLDGTVIVSIRGRGLFLSKDRGRTFTELGNELVSNNHSIELIEFSPRFSTDKTIMAASDEQVFISKNEGETWGRLSRPVRYENMRDAVKYTGNWKIIQGDEHSAFSVSRSSTKNDAVTLNFIGSGVTYLGPRSDDLGVAAIEIDGVQKGMVDLYSNNDEFASELFSVQGLELEAHSITVTVTGRKNQRSIGATIDIDAFDILPK